jgi:hypothetical protein
MTKIEPMSITNNYWNIWWNDVCFFSDERLKKLYLKVRTSPNGTGTTSDGFIPTILHDGTKDTEKINEIIDNVLAQSKYSQYLMKCLFKNLLFVEGKND